MSSENNQEDQTVGTGTPASFKGPSIRCGEASDRRVVYEVPEAGELIGLGRNASYAAAKRGDIPTIRVGKLLKVPRAAFHQKFGA